MGTDRATIFGQVAETYDRLRPRYPEAMYDDLVAESGLAPRSAILEIGAGTGIATIELVRRKFEVVAVDPDSRMLAVARDRLAGCSVTFVESTFRDFEAEPNSFQLVFAAGSWHWIDGSSGARQAASLLAEDGSLGVAWNLARPEGASRPAALDDVYLRLAPELASGASQVKNRTQNHRRREIAESGYFEQPTSFSYTWERLLSTADYCQLLATHADHRMLGAARLDRLLGAIGECVDSIGGSIRLPYETVMYVARRRD